MGSNQCTHYLIVIAKLMDAIAALERFPLPHSAAVVQAIKYDQATIEALEKEYRLCRG